MTLAQLIAQFRREADDAVAHYLFSDAAVTDWLNEAVDEACVRSLLIHDVSARQHKRKSVETLRTEVVGLVDRFGAL